MGPPALFLHCAKLKAQVPEGQRIGEFKDGQYGEVVQLL
jgi:hypothetical protein